MKWILLCLVVLTVLLIPNVSAQDVSVASTFTWSNSCLDNDTLLKEIIFEVDSSPTVLNQTLNCTFGCEDDLGKYGADCIEPDYILTFWVIIGIIGIFLLMLIALGRRR